MKSLLTSSRLSGTSLSLSAVIVLLLLSACSTQPPEQKGEYPQHYLHKKEPVTQTLPEVELSGELLFNILIAEFAADIGELTLSHNRYLRAAYASRDPRLAKRATQVAIFAKDYDSALTGAKLWVELEPEDLDARQSAATLFLLQRELNHARPHLIWLLEQDNYSAKQRIAVAHLMARAPRNVEVISLFEEINTTTGESSEQRIETLYATAILAQKRDKTETALNRLEQLLKINSRHADGALLRATLWFSANREEDAIKSLKNFLQNSPDNISVRLNYARMLIDTRDLKEGLAQFKILVRLTPRNGNIIYGYGILAIQNNRLDIAEDQFQKLIQLKLREAEARQSLGQLFELREQNDTAIKWYHSVPKGEYFFASQLRAAQLIFQRDGIQSARNFLQQIPALDRSEALQKLIAEAELLQGIGHYDDAFKLFTIALKAAPDNPELLYAHAMAAEKINRIDILEQDLTRVIKGDPNNIQALNALGYTLVDRTNRFAEAFEYIKRAYALDSQDPAILDSMGWALFRMGRHKEALEYLLRASRKHQDGEIYAHLGEVLWVSGDTIGARAVWDAALKFDPNHPVLIKTLKRFAP